MLVLEQYQAISIVVGLTGLETHVPESTKKTKAWPKATNSLSRRLGRNGNFLRSIGINVDFNRQSGTGEKTVYLERVDKIPSQSSQNGLTACNSNESSVTIPVTISNHCDDIERIPSQRKAACIDGFGDSDDSDDKIPIYSKEPMAETEVF
ncbi:MAG: hypothetical protein WCA08_15030 [Desulfoferrobacter sp.]